MVSTLLLRTVATPQSSGLRRLARALQHAFLLLCPLLLFVGCETSKDFQSRGNFERLHQTHLQFIDDFTEAEGKVWDDQRLATRTAAVRSEFAAAEQYEAAKPKEPLRKKALTNVHDQWKRHAAMLEKNKKFYRVKFAGELKGQVAQNYELLKQGEDARR